MLARNALADLETFWAEQFPRGLRHRVRAAAGRLLQRRPRERRPRRLPAGHRVRRRRLRRREQRLLLRRARRPELRLDQLRPRLPGRPRRGVRPVHPGAGDGARVRPRGAGPRGLAVGLDRRRDPGRLPGRHLDPVGRRGRGRALGPADARARRAAARLPAAARPGRAPARARSRRTAPTSTGSRPSRRASTSGAEACRDDFGPDRGFTQLPFTTDEDLDRRRGRAPDELSTIIDDVAARRLGAGLRRGLRGTFDPPSIESFDGDAPGCAPDQRPRPRLLRRREPRRLRHDRPGVARLQSWATSPSPPRSRCPTGWPCATSSACPPTTRRRRARRSASAAGTRRGCSRTRPEGRRISPGDIDESVQFLLAFGNEPSVVPAADLTGFQLVDLFRAGFVEGLDACGLEG